MDNKRLLEIFEDLLIIYEEAVKGYSHYELVCMGVEFGLCSCLNLKLYEKYNNRDERNEFYNLFGTRYPRSIGRQIHFQNSIEENSELLKVRLDFLRNEINEIKNLIN